jgi:hypothetical protein
VPVSKATPVHAPGPTHLEQTVAESASLLPVSDTTDGGYHHEMPIFKSGAEAVDYARKRYQAFDEKLKVQHARP